MKKIINGISVNYFGNSEKQPIVFIHGFPFDHKMWDAQIEGLKDDFFICAYDIRGFGESPVLDGQFSMETYVDDLFEVINTSEFGKSPVVCGLSMGGYILLRALERGDEKFAAAILCDTKADADNNAGKLKRAAAVKTINSEGLEKFTRELIPNVFTKKSIEELPAYGEIVERAVRYDPRATKAASLAMATRTDTNGVFAEINIPVLLICGVEDALTPPEVMQKMAAQIVDSEFVPVPEAAHMAPVENPDFVNNVIRSFINRRVLGLEE